MNILGIDPGVKSGWAIYDSVSRGVVDGGEFDEFALPEFSHRVDVAVLERPVGMGPTRPQMVHCGYVAGRLAERMRRFVRSEELTRLQVCQGLTAAMYGQILVRNDATVWAALKHLHGGEQAGKKGGPLFGVKSHGRAALAVAVALSLREAAQAGATA